MVDVMMVETRKIRPNARGTVLIPVTGTVPVRTYLLVRYKQGTSTVSQRQRTVQVPGTGFLY